MIILFMNIFFFVVEGKPLEQDLVFSSNVRLNFERGLVADHDGGRVSA